LRVLIQRVGRLLLAWLMLVASAPARAWSLDETKVDWRLALSADFYRAEGSMVASARYGGNWGLKLGAWVRDNNVIPHAPNVVAGADYVVTKSKWRFGAGVAWIDEESNINGTRWNFDLSLAYGFSDRVFLQYQHYSHGSGLGVRRDSYNYSWNLLGVGIVF
jgi:hypothetical protein